LKSTNYRKSIETIICFAYNGIVKKKKEVIIMQVEITGISRTQENETSKY